jgi:photosystem II stability/assembly factor-like uncharacterized protein
MKTLFVNQTRYLVAVVLMVIGVLLTCFSAVANARRGGARDATSAADFSPGEEDSDPEYLEKRREFLERFFGTGPGSVSPGAYISALEAARALPPSPLLQGRKFMSPETLEIMAPWISPIAPPIQNSYGGNASAMVQALAIDPLNANVIYTGSFGGLAKTTDGGGTWRYLSDTWTSQSVSAIAVNPNANVVYVGTGRDGYGPYGVGLYRSFDGGTTWSNLGAAQFGGTAIRAIAIGARNRTGLIVYVANGLSHDSGLWRSSDSGVTWTRLRQAGQPGSPGEYNGIHDLAVDPSTHPSMLYITDDDGVFKSVDSSQSWTQVLSLSACEPGEGCRPSRLSFVRSALYLLAGVGQDRNLYKSTNAGAEWTQLPSRCPCQTNLTNNCYGVGDTCASSDNIGFGVFAVDPFNPNVILGGNQALYRTDNEGMTWKEIEPWNGVNIHTDQRVIAFSQIAPGVAYDGNDGGVVRSTNDGLNWTNLNQNLPGALLYSVALSADGSMIAGTQDNGVVFSKVGARWDMIGGGDSSHDLIDPIGSAWAYSVIYGPSSFCRFNRQTRYSENISPDQFIVSENPRTYEPCVFFPTFSMNPSNPKHLLAACQHVVRTLDGPTVTHSGWTPIGNCPSASPAASPCPRGVVVTAATEAPSNSDVIYAVTNNDTVFVTQNAGQGNGATWSQVTHQNQPGGVNAVTVDPTNYQTAYLACSLGVYKTTNMGTTWTQRVPQRLQNLFYRDVAIDPANPQHVFATSNAGVFASTDGGMTWGNMTDGIPTGMAVTGLSFNAINRQLAASTYGRGVYMLNLGALPTVSISSSANLTTTSGL